MKNILFLDRDGTLIKEPEGTYQIDSLDKLEFIPGAIENLSEVAKSNKFDFVMVTNQDGLGTDSFPEEDFWPAHNSMLGTLKSKGVTFKDILIDRSFEKDNLPTRKPNTGLLTNYIENGFSSDSYVIGDRITDMQLAKNLDIKGILIENPLHQISGAEIESKGLKDTIVLKTDQWNRVGEFLTKGA